VINDIAFIVVLRGWYVNLNKITENINALTLFITGYFQRRLFQAETGLNCLEKYMLLMYLL
jgi:hypothetical protein